MSNVTTLALFLITLATLLLSFVNAVQDVKQEMGFCSYTLKKMHEITVERWQSKLKFSGVGYGEIEEDSEIGMTFLVPSKKASENDIPYFLGRCKTEMIETRSAPVQAPTFSDHEEAAFVAAAKSPELLLRASTTASDDSVATHQFSTLGLIAYGTDGQQVAVSVPLTKFSATQVTSRLNKDSATSVEQVNAKETLEVSCATYRIKGQTTLKPLFIEQLGSIVGSAANVNVSETVYKVGAATGKTEGRVKLVEYYHLTAKATVFDENLPKVELRKQIMIKSNNNGQAFCAAGDQGSVVVRKIADAKFEVIGMITHCFTDDTSPFKGYAIVTPWENIYWACKVTLSASKEAKSREDL